MSRAVCENSIVSSEDRKWSSTHTHTHTHTLKAFLSQKERTSKNEGRGLIKSFLLKSVVKRMPSSFLFTASNPTDVFCHAKAVNPARCVHMRCKCYTQSKFLSLTNAFCVKQHMQTLVQQDNLTVLQHVNREEGK